MPRPKSQPRSRLPTSIGFRLDAEEMRVLAGRAAQIGVSAHTLAKYYVKEALQEAEERAVIKEKLEQLQLEVAASRSDLASATEVILRSSDNLDNKDIADWVKRHLNLPCSRSPTP
jgi:hypothetical protein